MSRIKYIFRNPFRVISIISILIILMGVFYFFRAEALNTKTLRSQNNSKILLQQKPSDPAEAADKYKPDQVPKLVFKPGLVPVLMYHHVGDVPSKADFTRADLTVSTKDFNEQIKYLAAQGYQTIFLEQLYSALTKNEALPKKPIIITFDDGYSDVFENAVPILKENGMSGVFGIITGFVNTADYANWQQIGDAKNQGMEIVSHSYSHIDVGSSKYSDADRAYQVTEAQNDLAANLGFKNKFYIYPYGHYSLATEKALKSSGILMSFTTQYGITNKGMNLLELPRVRVHGHETMQHFAEYLNPVLLNKARANELKP